MIANLQIHIHGEWITLATFEQRDVSGNGYLEYEPEYIIDYKDDPHHRVGLLYPVNYELYSRLDWPAFLTDILPSGAGRRVWLRRLGMKDGESKELDWTLLLNGAGNPPGNIRVVESAIQAPDTPHPGFTMDEIVQKNADFIEYAEEMGAVVAGATDIPGDAPKFMVVRDQAGRWHPDGSLSDDKVADCWIVKFPRGKHERDFLVLRNEAPYYEVARWFGVRTGAPLMFRDDALFIPRFDRVPIEGILIRHGLETLCSVADIPERNRRGDHLEFCKAIAQVATDPKTELFEYLKREILNSALRNVDNHGRNTAFIKRYGKKIELSPLYDFAPMFLDPEGIARASLWGNGIEKTIGRPEWRDVVELLSDLADQVDMIEFLASLADSVMALPEKMKECGVEERVIQGVAPRCDEIGNDLDQLQRG